MRKILKRDTKTKPEKIADLEKQDMDLLESVAVVYETQLQSELDSFEAMAELYELIVGGGSIE